MAGTGRPWLSAVMIMMRRVLVIAAMLAAAAQAQGAAVKHKKAEPPKIPLLRLTIELQVDSDAPSGADAPILEWVPGRSTVHAPNGAAVDVIPDFHIAAAKARVATRRRELVDSDGAFADTQAASYAVDVAARAGPDAALTSGGWECGASKYYITLRTYVIDADGRRSNALRYTVHCNGG
jgi:hypothetical protein